MSVIKNLRFDDQVFLLCVGEVNMWRKQIVLRLRSCSSCPLHLSVMEHEKCYAIDPICPLRAVDPFRIVLSLCSPNLILFGTVYLIFPSTPRWNPRRTDTYEWMNTCKRYADDSFPLCFSKGLFRSTYIFRTS